MLLSIIIPYHNRIPLLCELVNSLPDADGVEVLLISDHCDLNWRNTRTFQCTTVRHFELPAGKRGAGACRNVGIAEATGKYLMFVDDDDIFMGTDTQLLLDTLQATKADVLYYFWHSFDTRGRTGRRHIPYNALVKAAFGTGCTDLLYRYHSPYGKIAKRAFVLEHEIRFGETMVSNDVLFNLNLCLAKPTLQLFNQTLFSIRQGHKGSLTISMNPETLVERLDVLYAYNTLLRERGLARLQVGAISQLIAMCRISPRLAVDQSRRAIKNGTPIFPSFRFIKLAVLSWLRSIG
jgi:hypothetical protein